MSATDFAAEQMVARATVDRDGCLVAADPAIEQLHERAGGTVGGTLAVPQLAAAARLARRLGIVVSRGVTVADDDADLELWVRAQPVGDAAAVRLAVSGWRELAPWRPAGGARAGEALIAADADWRWETDATLRVTFISLDAAARQGLDAWALLGRPLTQLFALDDTGDGLPILDALALRRAFEAQPARVRQTGRRVTLSAVVRRDAGGEFAGLIGTARGDEPMVVVAAGIDTAGFTAGLDRALRKPLARIVANADSIQAQTDGPLAPDYADYAADIAHAGRHLLALVDDLVDLDMVERDDLALAIEPIDLADVARRAASLLAVRAGQAGATIVRPAPDAVCPAWGDYRRALQIAVNLLGNALRYSPDGAAATVTTTADGGTAALVVADQGKGIAIADQARIFAKFERVDPTEIGGNGLGLYIARRLARAMRGDLTVASAPGEGARFTLVLPCGPSDPERSP